MAPTARATNATTRAATATIRSQPERDRPRLVPVLSTIGSASGTSSASMGSGCIMVCVSTGGDGRCPDDPAQFGSVVEHGGNPGLRPGARGQAVVVGEMVREPERPRIEL